jgi:hypothetical protein
MKKFRHIKFLKLKKIEIQTSIVSPANILKMLSKEIQTSQVSFAINVSNVIKISKQNSEISNFNSKLIFFNLKMLYKVWQNQVFNSSAMMNLLNLKNKA